MSESLPTEASSPASSTPEPAPPAPAEAPTTETPATNTPPTSPQSDATASEPPPIPAAPPAPERHTFVFHGREAEYFRIWIVNTLLTLLTFGVFAAWAKVRKRRYFRGNTELMGHRFDYRADPRRLLIGNIVVASLFAAYAFVGQVYPFAALGALAVGIVLLPWIVVRSLAFNAHNTTYRGMRFFFYQPAIGAAALYFGQFFLVLITFGLLYPGWLRKQRMFVINHHRLGDAFFNLEAPVGQFYIAHLVAGAILIPAALLGGMITAGIAATNRGHVATPAQLAPFFVIYGLAFFIAKQIVFARLFNHTWNHTRLDQHRFRADLETDAWLKLQLLNLVAVVGTAGLLYPWAQIRAARHALSHLHFEPAGSLDRIERLGRNTGSAFGETATEFAGLDFGL